MVLTHRVGKITPKAFNTPMCKEKKSWLVFTAFSMETYQGDYYLKIVVSSVNQKFIAEDQLLHALVKQKK